MTESNILTFPDYDGSPSEIDPMEPQRKALEAHMEAPLTIPIPKGQCALSEDTKRKLVRNAVIRASAELDDDFVADAWTWLPIIKVLGFIVLSAFIAGLVVRWMNGGVL